MDISLLATKGDLKAIREEMATKGDLKAIREEMATKGDLKALEQSTKADTNMLLEALKNLYSSQEDWKNELIEHFDVVAENIHHDMLDTFNDKISVLDDRTNDHGRRIRHLEKRIAA